MPESNELVVLNNLNPVSIFTENGADPLLEAIKKEVSSFVPDISTVKGRKEIASLANKVAKSKVYLDDLGKDLVSEWKEKSKKVDNERKRMREYLDDLRDEVRQPLTEYEEREEKRLQRHKDGISHLESFKALIHDSTNSSLIKGFLNDLTAISIDESWDEFKSLAEQKLNESKIFLTDKLAAKDKQEKEYAELERLRRENTEREQKEREERIAKEAATKAKAEADQKAKEEIERIEKEKAELALVSKLAAEKLELEKQQAIKMQKQAEENTRLANEKAAQDKIDSDKRAIEAAKKAEKDKLEAIEKAKEEARIFEVKKRELEEKELAKREANTKHLKLVNGEALTALIACTGISEEVGKKIITAIAKGEIPNVKINY